MNERHALAKVPEITIFFWIIKILTTGMGESLSDFLVIRINPVIAVAIGAVGLSIALVLQLSARRYVPWIYWLAVAMVAVFGTMAADVMHVGLHIPYSISSSFFAIVLAVIFALWHAFEKTLSIHSIYTRRRELFYWAAVMATFALGTAVGDLTAITLKLGYFSSGLLFTALIAFIAIAHYAVRGIFLMEHQRQSANAVFAFWLAYILTRPLGASFADWMGKSHAVGGLGIGDGTVSLYLTVLIVIFVAYISASRKNRKNIEQ